MKKRDKGLLVILSIALTGKRKTPLPDSQADIPDSMQVSPQILQCYNREHKRSHAIPNAGGDWRTIEQSARDVFSGEGEEEEQQTDRGKGETSRRLTSKCCEPR